MASPFRSYQSYFQDLEGTRQRPTTGGPATFQPGMTPEFMPPETPQSPRTPSFNPFGRQERPAAFQGFGADQPQPQPQPTRELAAAVGGQRRQAPSRQVPQGFGSQPRSLYSSNYTPSAGPTPAPQTAPAPQPVAQPAAAPQPQTGGPLVQEPAPTTGGPLTYQPPAPAAVSPPAPQPVSAAELPPIYGLPEPRQLVGYEAPQATQDFYSQLTSPLLENLQEGYGTLGGAVQDFYGQLPDIQTWEALGGPGLVQAALGPAGPERLAAEEQLREILGAAYEGPAGLQGIEDLYGIQADLQPYGAGALGSMAGTGALLQGLAPGLTPGQRREEARRLLADEDYRTYARQLGRDISRLGGTARAETEAAQEAALGQRQAAGALRGAGTEALTGEREAISADIAERTEAARAERAAIEQAYDEYSRTGDLAVLSPYGITPEMFESDLTRLDVEAQQVKQQILDDPRFAEIADVPLMEYSISSHGREKLNFPDEWYEENKGKYTKREMAELKKLARARQKALDEAGFARQNRRGPGGKYAGVESIYFGGDRFDPTELDQAAYLDLEGGAPATRHNIATAAQREDFNIINDILGQADRLQESDPYEAAQILADTEAYLDDLQTQYEEVFGELEETGKRFDKLRRKIRKKHRSATSGTQKALDVLEVMGGKSITGVARPGAAITGGHG